jgi:hypothetical protein
MIKVEIFGTLIEKSKPVQISDKMTKSEIVIESNSGKYPDYVKIEVVNDDLQKIEGVRTLEEVKATCYLQGRKYNDKKTGELRYFNSIRLQSIEKLSSRNPHDSLIEDEEMF